MSTLCHICHKLTTTVDGLCTKCGKLKEKVRKEMTDEYTVIDDQGETWTRHTKNGAQGLADYLAFKGRGGKVYSTNSLAFPNPEPMYIGVSEEVEGVVR